MNYNNVINMYTLVVSTHIHSLTSGSPSALKHTVTKKTKMEKGGEKKTQN